ncbi:MAG: hypothetical protein AAGK66_07405 [Pseudomonadota bacterium]
MTSSEDAPILSISFDVIYNPSGEIDGHQLGNIADDVWKSHLACERYRVEDDRFIAFMYTLIGRDLRKKERDELNKRVEALAKRMPHLNPTVNYGGIS